MQRDTSAKRKRYPYSRSSNVYRAPSGKRVYMGPPRLPYQQAQPYGRPGLTEVKCCDMVLAAPAVLLLPAAVVGAEPVAAYTGITEINLIQQGATVAQRIGNKVVLKSIHVTAHFNVLAVANSGTIRVMVVYDKQTNGAFPALTDIILAQPAGAASPLSGINIANKSRFQMIRDKYFNLSGGGTTGYVFDEYCKGRWEVEYGANAGNIGDFRTGAVYFVAYYLSAIVAGPTLAFLHCRNRYYD